MAFRRAPNCNCCTVECTCECPDAYADKVIGSAIVSLGGFQAASAYDCGICDEISGEYQLTHGVGTQANEGPFVVPPTCFFEPRLDPAPDEYDSCLGVYVSGLSGTMPSNSVQNDFFCGDYEPLMAVILGVVGRTYCAYQANGKIYRPETAPSGAALIGRAFEVRAMILGVATGIYDPGNYCYAVSLAEAQYATSLDLCYANITQYGFEFACCDAPANFYNTLEPCVSDCGYYGNPLEPRCVDPMCWIAYGMWAWRTILPINRKCDGLDETLRLITDEEELSREYVFQNHRLRAAIGGDTCSKFALCDPPLTIRLEI